MKSLPTLAILLLVTLPLPAVEIVGHRGASFDAPENTVASFKLNWANGADASELDVWPSKDGKLIVSHDENLKRTSGIDRKIGDMTAAELANVDVGSWKGARFKGEKLPTLADMLATCPPGKRVFIEVKAGPEVVPELDRVMHASGLKPEQTVVIAFNAEVIAAVKKLRPDVKAYWIVSLAAKKDKPSPTVESLIATGKRVHADGLDLSATEKVLTKPYASAIKAAGFMLLVWTVDDVELARKMIAVGVESITTNRSKFLRARLAQDPAAVHVMSFNIRYAAAKDGDNDWVKRKDFLVETIKAYDPDLLGTQETLPLQRDELTSKLTGHQGFAAGRNDGKDDGEMMAVYYRKSRFEKLDGGHFWLSETPNVAGSKSWDSSLPRMATWMKLKDRRAPQAEPIFYLNTHFDHRGPTSRLEAAKLVRAKLAELGKGCRVIVTGDFNIGDDSKPYATLFDKESPVVDTWRVKHPEKGATEGTFSSFKPGPAAGRRIDWIGCSKDWTVDDAVIDYTERDGHTPSDHFPIEATLSPPKTTLRVLSYNIHHGEGMDRKVDLPRLASVMMAANPDFVAVQEVDCKTKRTSGVDQAAELARLTGLHGAFGKAIDYEGGGYGQMILSRYPLADATVHRLPGQDKEQRIAFAATVSVNGQPLQFVTTHLNHNNPAEREGQAAKLAEIFADAKSPVILAGDLNAVPESAPVSRLSKSFALTSVRDAFTVPSTKPTRQIDYVLLKAPAGWTLGNPTVLPEAVASDHRAVLAIVELPH